MINDTKTEFLIIGTHQQLEKMSIDSIVVCDAVIKPLVSILWSWFDVHVRMDVFRYDLWQGFSWTLQHLADQKTPLNVIDKDTCPCFVSSHLDYCNLLLFGLP